LPSQPRIAAASFSEQMIKQLLDHLEGIVGTWAATRAVHIENSI
jgi:hypothetical protein